MKASDIVTRALNLADLANADFILYNDRAQSLFEAYRDIYAKYIEANSDFFLNDTVIQITPEMLLPNSSSGLNEYLVPLPSDFLRERFIEWMGYGTYWQPIEKFAVQNKNTWGAYPRYRTRADGLWIVGTTVMGISQVRVGYYPMQPAVTVPDFPIQFAQSQPAFNIPSITWPVYIPETHGMIYILKTNTNYYSILYESMDAGTNLPSGNPVVLAAPAQITTPTDLSYYGGVMYYLNGDDIYSGQTNLDGIVNITNFSNVGNIIAFNLYYEIGTLGTPGMKIWWTTTTHSGFSSLGSWNPSEVQPFVTTYFGMLLDGSYFWLDTNAALNVRLLSPFQSNIPYGVYVSAFTDGTYIYVQDVPGNVWQLSSLVIDSVGHLTFTQTLVVSGVRQVGNVTIPQSSADFPWMSVLLNYGNSLQAISLVTDYDFSFPNNEANELMAYQLAIDFRRKQTGKPDLYQMLLDRKSEIELRFAEVIHRDDFAPERIGNVYQKGWW